MNVETFQAFSDEVEKIALSRNSKERIRNAAALGTSAGGIGYLLAGGKVGLFAGGAGALTGALLDPKKQREIDDVIDLKERGQKKTAGLLQNIGMRIAKKSTAAARAAVNAAKAAPGQAVDFAKSVPGHVRGGIQNAGSAVSAFSTPVDSLKKGFKMTTRDFGSMSNTQKALMISGLAGSAHEGLAKEDPYRQGRGRIERATTAVGDQIGGLIGTPFGITGGIVGSQIGRKAGMLVGKGAEGASKLLKRKKKEEPSSPSP